MSSFHDLPLTCEGDDPDDKETTKDPTRDQQLRKQREQHGGLAGLVSRFANFRDHQQHVQQYDSSESEKEEEEDEEDNDNTETSSSEDDSLIPHHPQSEMIKRLLSARESLPPDKADAITQILNSLNLGIDFTPAPRVLKTHVFGPSHTPPTLDHLASLFSSPSGPTYKRILVLTGAGVSVSAGIPDFRTPGTGLYSNLQRYNLPHPQAVFDLDFYRNNPSPFCTLASEIWPGNHLPTLTHAFLKVLSDKGLLLRLYTQNIDGLEVLAGVPEEKVVEVSGRPSSLRVNPLRIRFYFSNLPSLVGSATVTSARRAAHPAALKWTSLQ